MQLCIAYRPRFGCLLTSSSKAPILQGQPRQSTPIKCWASILFCLSWYIFIFFTLPESLAIHCTFQIIFSAYALALHPQTHNWTFFHGTPLETPVHSFVIMPHYSERIVMLRSLLNHFHPGQGVFLQTFADRLVRISYLSLWMRPTATDMVT